MRKLSMQEFFIGVVSTLTLALKIGWWVVPLSVICGALWMLGGTYEKVIRRIGVPSAVCIFAAAILGWHLVFVFVPIIGFAVLTIGDGFPDHRTTTKDEGSALGRFIERFIPDVNIGGLVTKLTIVVLIQLAWIPIFVSQ